MREARSMDFTGERFVPTLDGQIKYEHLHRYALALDFVAGKTALDLGSGEGYGAALLARVAAKVTGVDNSPEAVEHSRRNYYYQNLEFLVGGCDAVPLADASADVVTAFEIIEHHDKHEQMMSEVKRVLRPGGVHIISSPNRLTYSDEPNYANPFHVKELYYDEFYSLLSRYFKHVCVYGQRLATGSFVYQLQNAQARHLKTFSGDVEHLTQQLGSLPAPLYFVAICSDEAVAEPHAVNSVYLDGNDDLLKQAEAERIDLFKQVKEQFGQFDEYQQLRQALEDERAQLSASHAEALQFEARLRRQDEELADKEAEMAALKSRLAYAEALAGQQAAEAERASGRLTEKEAQASRQAEELSELHAQLSGQRTQLAQMTYLLSEARVRLANKQALLSWMMHSRSWKVTTPLRQMSLSGYKLRQKLTRSGSEVFRGFVDSPVEGGTAAGYIEVVGWAYSVNAPVIRVEAFLDNMPLGTVRYGHARPDVAGALPSQAPLDCGFASRLPLDELLIGRRTLMIRVTDERGNFRDYKRTVVIEWPSGAHVFDAPPPQALLPAAAAEGETAALLDTFLGDNLSTSKKLLSSMAETYLSTFLLSDSTIEIPQFERPEISVILVLYNRAELTLQCLLSLLRSNTGPFEVVIVDNASTDETKFLLKRIKGARVIHNPTNLHYLLACNQAAREARGEYLLLLNNDTQVLAGSIPSALDTLRSAEDIGAVGGKIILPDGTLQEAGSIVWRDGSCLGYGRGDSPSASAYMFRRDVDYCSAAFLLTRRELFVEGGGFDEDFAPAYYEETDYCARLWERGLRVVYDPNAIVLHYEFASSGSQHDAIQLQAKHQKVFGHKHRDWLAAKHVSAPSNVLAARAALPAGGRRILFMDDRVPHVTIGSGFPRSNRILSELVRMKYFVTLFPLNFPQEEWASVYQDVPREVEVMLEYGLPRLEEFLKERGRYYDYIFVSRPHNMASLKSLLSRNPHLCPEAKIIYDAEALFSLREVGQMRVEGKRPSAEQERRLVSEELSLAEDCYCVISVSENESREFTQHGFERVHTLGHSISVSPTPGGFDDRADILFVGAMYSPTSPNGDSMIWFAEKVFPLIKKRLGADLKLHVAGSICLELKSRFGGDSIQVLGKVEDLTGLYNRSRLFIAPTRYSAGIPHKVHEAAAHGLPVVATPLIGRQLGWEHGEELLLANDAETFAAACVRLYRDQQLWERLRRNALRRVETDCSPAEFAKRLRAIIESDGGR